MEVILDNEKNPQGVYLPLTEWDTLKNGINKASNLYRLMEELSHPDVFEMNAEQFSQYLEPVAAGAVNKALENGLYVSCPAGADMPNAFIQEYQNGRKILVEVDQRTGKEHFIRNL